MKDLFDSLLVVLISFVNLDFLLLFVFGNS